MKSMAIAIVHFYGSAIYCTNNLCCVVVMWIPLKTCFECETRMHTNYLYCIEIRREEIFWSPTTILKKVFCIFGSLHTNSLHTNCFHPNLLVSFPKKQKLCVTLIILDIQCIQVMNICYEVTEYDILFEINVFLPK